MTSIIVRRSMPALAAIASASSETQVAAKASRLFTSFAVLPSPSGPTWKTARPSFWRSGRQRS